MVTFDQESSSSSSAQPNSHVVPSTNVKATSTKRKAREQSMTKPKQSKPVNFLRDLSNLISSHGDPLAEKEEEIALEDDEESDDSEGEDEDKGAMQMSPVFEDAEIGYRWDALDDEVGE